jgi:hypothetical protein
MPGVVKVGYSTKDPELRASELNNTGAPHPYVVEYEALVEEPCDIEHRVHRKLSAHREGREWFRCSPEFAVSVVQAMIGGGIITESFERVDRAKAEALRRERDEQRVREERNEALWREQERQIRAKYDQQLRAAFPEHWAIGYMVVIFLLTGVGLTILMPKLSDGQYGFWSLLVGVIGGFLAKNWHQEHRRASRSYQSVLKQRDEEVASVRNVVVPCPRCKQNLRVPRARSLTVTCPSCQHTFPSTT